jgi:hypothetical protein
MRDAARRLGEHLRATVGFRGAFTLDGISGADGWVATECNPRFGAGLGYVDAVLPDLKFLLLHHAVTEGVVDVPSAALEDAVGAAATSAAWGGAWTSVERRFDDTTTVPLAGDERGYRRARTEPPDVVLSVGPGRTGGHVRLDFDPARTPRGPSIAPRAAAGFAFADHEFRLGVPTLTPALDA